MNRQLKKRIQQAFESPKPNQKEKEAFLRTLPQPKISMLQFALIQAAYLRKWVLLLSILLLFPALIGAYRSDLHILWVVSAVVPFLGFLAVAESTRSMLYGMNELEMSTRFSLNSVVLARMSVLGLLDGFIFCCFIPLCCISDHTSFLQTGICLLVPYLLTVNISLWIVRHFRGKEVIYACMSVAVLVSTVSIWLRFMTEFIYPFSNMKWWLMLLGLLVGSMIYEICCTIKQTEELAWSL
ncbi:MAG: hypothetical protein K2P45_04755 [Eubacterium sp.]|nr:hypothetical protein [Eubacterium sp.]